MNNNDFISEYTKCLFDVGKNITSPHYMILVFDTIKKSFMHKIKILDGVSFSLNGEDIKVELTDVLNDDETKSLSILLIREMTNASTKESKEAMISFINAKLNKEAKQKISDLKIDMNSRII